MALRAALAAAAASLAAAVPCPGTVTVLGFHAPECDAAGNLAPPAAFGSVQAAVDASVAYYGASPLDLPDSHGFPPYVWATFTDGAYIPTSFDIIAGFQDGLAVLGYVKLARRAAAGRGGNATEALRAAAFHADYLMNWTLTPPAGAWSPHLPMAQQASCRLCSPITGVLSRVPATMASCAFCWWPVPSACSTRSMRQYQVLRWGVRAKWAWPARWPQVVWWRHSTAPTSRSKTPPRSAWNTTWV
jgi:hypothetical protein